MDSKCTLFTGGAIACGAILISCATLQKHVILDGAEIRNDSLHEVRDVEALHEPTMKMGKVNQILPQHSFFLRFSQAPMLSKTSTLTWATRDGRRYQKQFTLPANDEAARAGRPMRLVYVIQSGGRAEVRLVPSP